jgi:hypothetical protein
MCGHVGLKRGGLGEGVEPVTSCHALMATIRSKGLFALIFEGFYTIILALYQRIIQYCTNSVG